MHPPSKLLGDYAQLPDKKGDLVAFFRGLDTGDVLLYKCRGFTAWGIRATLKTDWDHVGVVYRRKPGSSRAKNVGSTKEESLKKCDPYYCSCITSALSEEGVEVIEATAAGVHIYPLEERLARRTHHDVFIAVRKLQGFNRADPKLDAVTEEFVRETHGHGYNFYNIGKYAALAANKNLAMTDDQRLKRTSVRESSKKSQRAFCSELVASYLLSVGILHEDADASKIDPGMFGSSDGLVDKLLAPGLSYAPELVFMARKGVARALLSRLKQELESSSAARKRAKGAVSVTTSVGAGPDASCAVCTYRSVESIKRDINSGKFSAKMNEYAHSVIQSVAPSDEL
jgi:hypothetical protein